ncbi:gamma-glutamylcyclotransferase [Salibacterium salarium]|uniref:Gamma-glutamylcyclotransferase n=1 Tax=Salibacterium salarium TaxID=284579 RepID=A0A3R9PJY3_9BACI|nr:gamma-glutamylcyclotransferase family protein [Salibacterium salarium]RSL32418.1 gamma-glutamylcyclotransferase [Salibacterium salarium]
MNEKLPVFVYGTLRKGLHNYENILEGQTTNEIAATTVGSLYAVSHESFPCLVKEGKTVIQGEIMCIKEDRYEEILKKLDALEGYDERNVQESDYVREITTVVDDKGHHVEAYTYYWNQPQGLGQFITSGCWQTYLKEKRKMKC